jgi:hypothetical protein
MKIYNNEIPAREIILNGQRHDLYFANYSDGMRTALILMTKQHEVAMIATVNVPEEHIEEDEVIIKNYSENEGILDVLIDAGIISKPLRSVEVGYALVHICKLLIEGPIKEQKNE